MPKNKVSDLITDQEIAFARLILSGTMTDRCAAEAAGINPDSAAYTKAKPRVHAYMREHRAAMQQQLLQQEAEAQRRLSLDREQVLARLWEIANLSPEMTRGSITGQVKALSMIVAMQNFIPNSVPTRLVVPTEKNPPPAPTQPQIYAAAWRTGPQATTIPAQPSPAPAHQEEFPGVSDAKPVPGSAGEAHPDPEPLATDFSPSQPQPPAPRIPIITSVPDARASFSINKNPFARRR